MSHVHFSRPWVAPLATPWSKTWTFAQGYSEKIDDLGGSMVNHPPKDVV